MAAINSSVKNSRVSLNGKDIILDYEFELHAYHNEQVLRDNGLVPVEMYPYEDDVLVGYIHVDTRFGVVDLQELYDWATNAIKAEKVIIDKDE